jgi:hypothetical protein
VGSYDTALLLVKNGADVNIKSENGLPIEIANRTKSIQIIQLLETSDMSGTTYSAFYSDSELFTRSASKFMESSAEIEDDDSDRLSTSINNFTLRPSSAIEAIIHRVPGLTIEAPKKNASKDRSLLFQPCNYKNWFFYSVDHHNFVGRINRARVTDKFEPLIVSVLPEPLKLRYRIIIWTRMGDKQIFVSWDKSHKGIKWSKGIPVDIEKKLKETILANFRPKEAELLMNLEYIKTDDGFKDKLYEFEAFDPLVHIQFSCAYSVQRPRCFSVGVLYAKDGQTTETENFNNGIEQHITPIVTLSRIWKPRIQ